MVPYTKGLSKIFKNVCGMVGVQVPFKGRNIISNLLVAPKEGDEITQKNGEIYRFKCDEVGCEGEYIDELTRTFKGRFKEHLRAPFPIYYHGYTSGHCIVIDNFSIVDRQAHNSTRTIKDAKYIRVNDLSLKRNIDKFQLPNIWHEVLQDTPDSHLK